jgi:predicted amidohydrolase
MHVACLQLPCVMGQSVDAVVESLYSQVRTADADLVVFPELWGLAMAAPAADPVREVPRVATECTPRFFEAVESVALETGTAVLAGTVPCIEGSQLLNTALLALPDGRCVRQHKLFPTHEERDWGIAGGEVVQVVDTDWGRLCVLICYDVEFPSVSTLLGPLNPELFVVPSMTGPDGLYRVRWAAQARAVEHHAFVVVAGITDSVVYGDRFHARAAVLTPREVGFPGVLAEGAFDVPQAVHAQLDFDKLRASREDAGMYPVRDAAHRTNPRRAMLEESKPSSTVNPTNT